MNNTAQIFMISSQYDVIQSGSSLSPPASLHPLLEKTVKCTYFFSLWPIKNSSLTWGLKLLIACSSQTIFLYSPLHFHYHQTEQKSLPHHFGELQVFAALLWSAGKFSKGDGECDWGVSSWHLRITEIVGAADGATASNGSLIFLDVERRDPLSDSTSVWKGQLCWLGILQVIEIFCHQNKGISNLNQGCIFTNFEITFSTMREHNSITVFLW